ADPAPGAPGEGAPLGSTLFSKGAGAAGPVHRGAARPAMAHALGPEPGRGGGRNPGATPAACSGPPVGSPPARLLAALSVSPATVDTLAARSGLGVDAALAALLELEWAGLAAPGPGPRWTRAPL